MKWSHITNREWAALERRKADGRPTKPLDERPDINESETTIWDYFWTLRHFVPAPAFAGVNGIPATEIDAWLKHFNPVFFDEHDKLHVLKTIVRMDREYAKLVNDRLESKKGKSPVKGSNGRHSSRVRS